MRTLHSPTILTYLSIVAGIDVLALTTSQIEVTSTKQIRLSGITNLRYFVYVFTYCRHVISPLEQTLPVELPACIATRGFNLSSSFEIRLLPLIQRSLGFRSLYLDGRWRISVE